MSERKWKVGHSALGKRAIRTDEPDMDSGGLTLFWIESESLAERVVRDHNTLLGERQEPVGKPGYFFFADTPGVAIPWQKIALMLREAGHDVMVQPGFAPRREPDRPGSLVEALEGFEPWMVGFLQNAAEDEPAWKHRLLSIHDAITRALTAQEADHE